MKNNMEIREKSSKRKKSDVNNLCKALLQKMYMYEKKIRNQVSRQEEVRAYVIVEIFSRILFITIRLHRPASMYPRLNCIQVVKRVRFVPLELMLQYNTQISHQWHSNNNKNTIITIATPASSCLAHCGRELRKKGNRY